MIATEGRPAQRPFTAGQHGTYATTLATLLAESGAGTTEHNLSQTILAQFPQAVLVAEAPSGRLVFANAHAEDLWRRLPPTKSIGDYAAWTAWHPDGRPVRPEEWPMARALLHGDSTTHAEFRVRRGDDSSAWVRACGAPVRGPDGRVIAGVVVFEDVTQDRATADALRASEERFRLVSLATRDVVWDWDVPRDRVTWSTVLEDAFGWRSDDLQPGHASWSHLLHRDDHDRVRDSFARFLDGPGSAWREEYRFQRRDGSFGPVLDRAFVQRDDAGRPRRVVGALTDLADHRHSGDAFRAQKDLYDTLVRAQSDLGEGVLVASGTHLEFANDAVARLTGYSVAELTDPAFDLRVLWPEDDPPHLEERHHAWVDGAGPGRRRPRTLRRKDGTTFLVEISTMGLPNHGDGPRRIILLRDVTDWERTRDELERAVADRTRALTRANRDLGLFNGMVAHDLRAPLRGITHLTRVLTEEHAHRLDKSGRRVVSRVQESATRLTGLVNALLGLAHAAHGSVHFTPVDVTAVARDAFERALSHEDPARRVEFVVQEDLVARADPALLTLALDNLFSNALKFTRARNPARIEVGAAADDAALGTWTLFVKDNGVGLDAQDAPDLFEAFERAGASPTVEGHGIGLAIVQRVVTRLGGIVRADGEPGKGATFFLTLPTE